MADPQDKPPTRPDYAPSWLPTSDPAPNLSTWPMVWANRDTLGALEALRNEAKASQVTDLFSSGMEIGLRGTGGPDASPILLLHSGQEDGRICFARKLPDGTWDPLASLTPAELGQFFPEFRTWLLRDAYFTPNAFRVKGNPLRKSTGLPYPVKTKTNLAYLNACYADLDCGRPEDPDPSKRATPEEMLGLCQFAVGRKLLPQFSMACYSGRGLYLLWLLRNPQDGKPERANVDRVELWQEVQRAIGTRLEFRAWDKTSVDATKYLRVPGSTHSGAGQSTRFMQAWSDAGRPPMYSLNDLATFFGARLLSRDEHPEPQRLAYEAPRTRNPNKRRGFEAVGERLAADWRKLERHNKGWEQGERAKCLSFYALFLRRAGYAQETAYDLTREMAANCRPPYPSDKTDATPRALVAAAWNSGRKRFKTAWLAQNFGVTPELAGSIGLQSILPASVRAERREAILTRKQTTARRRFFIDSWLKKHNRLGTPPSRRAMVKILDGAGFEVSYQTVHKDYLHLGIIRAPGTSGRPPKAPKVVQ